MNNTGFVNQHVREAKNSTIIGIKIDELYLPVSPFSKRPADLQRAFDSLIADKTESFVGRQFVFDAITQFMKDKPCGYFFVRGDPGIGKSSLAAQLVKQKKCVH